MAISQLLEEQGKLAPAFWNSDARSEECLLLLKADLKSMWFIPRKKVYPSGIVRVLVEAPPGLFTGHKR